MDYEQTIINEFEQCSNISELKKKYIELVRKFHPDKGGNLEICKLVNTLYSQFANKIKDIHEHAKSDRGDNFDFAESAENVEIDDKLKDVIFTLSSLPLDLEICGSWLWVTGRTWLFSKQLKALGCIFASRKKAWCFHVDKWVKRKHKLTLDEIRDLHGSVKVNNKQTFHIR